MKIEDGTGSGKFAKVNARNRLDVSSSSFTEAHLISLTEAQTYIWTSSFSADSGEEVIYIKNTSKDKLLILDHIKTGGVLTGLFELYQVTGTAGGTSITGKNTNLVSSNTADVDSLGDASVTGLTIGDRIDLVRVPATDSKILDLRDTVVLGFNDAIAVTYTGSTGIVDVSILGYYREVSSI